MKIIDDVMPVVMQNQLHSMCISQDFSWGFLEDCTFNNDQLAAHMNKPRYPAFCHLALMDGKTRNETATLMSSMLLCMSDKAGLNPNHLHRARFGMYLPIRNPPLHNNIHTDMKEPHTVCLYYVNDADGDTFFFDKSRQIVERISPKKGRMVVFDGFTLHASSMPVESSHRISLNLGYVKRVS